MRTTTTATTKRNYADVLREKKVLCEIVEKLLRETDTMEQWNCQEYKKVGEEQAKDFHDGEFWYVDDDGEKTKENTGNPFMRDIYDYVAKPDDELTDDDKLYMRMLEKVRDTLASMV